MTYENEQREEHENELDKLEGNRIHEAIAHTDREIENLHRTVERLERENKELVDVLRETEEALGTFDFGKLMSVGRLMGIAKIMHNINTALGGE